MAWMAVSMVPCAVITTTLASGRTSRIRSSTVSPSTPGHAHVEEHQIEGLRLEGAQGALAVADRVTAS